MKRFIFSSIAMVLAATACTESGVIDTPSFYGNAIVFDTYIGKNPVTKAPNWGLTQLKEGTNKGIKLYAFYQNPATLEVDYSEAFMDGALYFSSAWAYYEGTQTTSTDVYWPEGHNLAFAAYSLNASNQITSSGDMTVFDFTVNDNVSSQVDLLAIPLTSVSGNQSGDTRVTLNFHHLLSRVGYKVYATTGGVDIEIKSIRLCGAFPKKGKVDLKTVPAAIQPYTGDGAAYTYSYEFFDSGKSFKINSDNCSTTKDDAARIYANTSGAATVKDTEDYYMMIMPGFVDNPYIEVTYTLAGSSENYAKVDLGNWTFKAGFAYEFVFKIATSSIEFSASVVEGGWDTTGGTIEKIL